MKDKKEEHIFVDANTKPVTMHCQNCGKRTIFPNGESATYIIDCLNSFNKIHKNCVKKDV